MKKILLASTILVGSAGIAAAETANFSFSGAAYFGASYNVTTTTFAPELSSSFTVGMSSTTDMGLEVGASIKVTAPGVTTESDHTDAGFGISTPTATTAVLVSETSVYLSGDWGKLAAVYDQNGAGTTYDVVATYSNTWGDFGMSAYYTISPGVTNGDLGVKGTYSFGDYSVYAGANYDNSATDWDIDFGGSATMSGFTLAVDANYDVTPAALTWKASAGYTTGAYTVGAFVEDDDNANGFDWGLNGSYALGGGVSVDAAVIRDNDTAQTLVKAGVSMAF